jgi:hypothetical protein
MNGIAVQTGYVMKSVESGGCPTFTGVKNVEQQRRSDVFGGCPGEQFAATLHVSDSRRIEELFPTFS